MSQPRHILMTADTIGGVWTYSLQLARGLVEHDIRVSLATMGNPLAPEQWAEATEIAGLQVFESSYKLEWMDEPWVDVEKAGEWLLSLKSTLEPDIVHLNGYAHGALQWHCPVLMVAHSCVMSWWEAVKGFPAPSEWDTYRRRVREGLLQADMVVAVSDAMARAVDSWYGPLSSVGVIYNGRSGTYFTQGCKEPFILTTGRIWDEAKNVRGMEEASAKLRWPVMVAGEQEHPNGGTREVRGMRPLGRLAPDELRTWYARAAVYALPARYEPFGLSSLEAALSGCALVLGDIESLREIWGDAAQFVAPNEAEALVRTLDALMSDASQREAWAEKARTRALTFTPEAMTEGYLNAYCDAFSRHDGKRKTGAPCVL